MRLPEIVKEVGKTSEGNRVYVEDYVYTYLFKLKAEDRGFPLRAALYGHVCKKDDKNIITAAQIYEDIQLKTAIDSVKIIEKISQKGEQK